MSKFKLELNSSGIREFLRSADMQKEMERQAELFTEKLGGDFELDPYVGVGRVNVSLSGDTIDNELLKQLGVEIPEVRTGKKVEGYWRTLKSGKKIWVNAYQRRK